MYISYFVKMGDSRKCPYLYHGRLFRFPKGRGVHDYGILRAWGGIYIWKSEGIRGIPLVGFLEKKVYSEFLENAIIVDFYSS